MPPRHRRRLSRRSKYPPPAPEGSQQGRRRRLKQWIFPALVVLLLGVLAMAFYVALRKPKPAPVPDAPPFPLADDPFGLSPKPR